MLKFVYYTLCALLVWHGLVAYSEAAFVNATSYLDDMRLSYENGIWQCDMITCPLGVYGCKIQRNNLGRNSTQLLRINTCYHKNDAIVRLVQTTEDIPPRKEVQINLISFIDAVSVYRTSYAIEVPTRITTQIVDGIIEADRWDHLLNTTNEMIKEVEEAAGGGITKTVGM